ncbi:MAG: HD domain-containing protein [Actinomycetota bacterium]
MHDLDPDRLGGPGWLDRSGGRLTSAERRRLVATVLGAQARGLLGRLRLATGHRGRADLDPGDPPTSRLTRTAEEAAAVQSAALLGHARRTWVFGRALAGHDGVALDDELFYVGCLLHDVGLMEVVAGEDFTRRSAEAATTAAMASDRPEVGDRLGDVIVAHTTPGLTIERDGAEAVYLQAGATCDLGGLRLETFAADDVGRLLDRHPRGGLVADIVPRIRAEADAVPDGRFALLCRLGFPQAIRLAPGFGEQR